VPSSLAPTDVAGIPGIKQANWNNINGSTGTNNNLVADQNGTAVNTTIQVTFASSGSWSTMGDGETNNIWTGADAKLMTAYLDTGAATTTTVTINNITAPLTSNGYDVYVYCTGGVGAKGGGYRIVDPASGAVLKDYVHAGSAWFAPDYVSVSDNTSATAPGIGSYVVFRGLTAPNIKLEASTANGLGFVARGAPGDPRAPVNAIQLVAPTTSVVVTPPTLSIRVSGATLTITFEGTLQSRDTISGTWTDVAGATSPYPVTPAGTQKFYRAKR
jgi:hypothetical protein